jgi:hypothetical protein
VPRLSRAWRRRVAWYPGDWIWPSLLALLIAALAGTGSAAFVAHDRSSPGYVNETSPVGSVGSTAAPPEQTTPTTTAAATQPQPSQPPPPPPASRALTVWPAGKSGWTVVLQSLPITGGRDFALAQARAAQHAGLTQVGILDSSKFSSLHPGYYVLFTGIDSSFADADTDAAGARARGYPRAYARRITP